MFLDETSQENFFNNSSNTKAKHIIRTYNSPSNLTKNYYNKKRLYKKYEVNFENIIVDIFSKFEGFSIVEMKYDNGSDDMQMVIRFYYSSKTWRKFKDFLPRLRLSKDQYFNDDTNCYYFIINNLLWELNLGINYMDNERINKIYEVPCTFKLLYSNYDEKLNNISLKGIFDIIKNNDDFDSESFVVNKAFVSFNIDIGFDFEILSNKSQIYLDGKTLYIFNDKIYYDTLNEGIVKKAVSAAAKAATYPVNNKFLNPASHLKTRSEKLVKLPDSMIKEHYEDNKKRILKKAKKRKYRFIVRENETVKRFMHKMNHRWRDNKIKFETTVIDGKVMIKEYNKEQKEYIRIIDILCLNKHDKIKVITFRIADKKFKNSTGENEDDKSSDDDE